MKCERVNFDLLVRALDRELTPEEAAWAPAHIAACPLCRPESEALEGLSQTLGTLVAKAPVIEQISDRDEIARLKTPRQAPGRVLRRFGWGMAIAAALAVGIIVAPEKQNLTPAGPAHPPAGALSSNAIEVDGETFVALPYSNPDLPSNAPRIVQMQVPVSSLATIGLGLDQAPNEISNQDRTVLADVLLGADGQPLGVHVVSWE